MVRTLACKLRGVPIPKVIPKYRPPINPVHDTATPSWQLPITSFFPVVERTNEKISMNKNEKKIKLFRGDKKRNYGKKL